MQIVVIGGGLTGIAAARAHQDKGHDVTLVTNDSHLGGVLATTVIDGVPRNHSAQSFALTADLTALFTAWGVRDALFDAPPEAGTRCIVYQGRVHRLNSPLHLITSRLVPVTTVLKALLRLGKPLPEGEPTIAEIVRYYADQVVVERLARPIVAGIFAGDPERLSFKACFPSVGRASPRRMGRTRRSVVLPIHGMADFAGRLADGLTDVRLGWWAQSIEQSSNMWVVRSDHDVIHADRVILTVSAHSAASLVSEHDSLLGTKLSAMAYGGVRVLHCSYWKYQQAVTLHAFGALWADSGPVRGMVDLSMLMHVQSDRQFAVVFITPGATTEEAMSEVRRVFKISGEIQIDLEIDWTHAIPQYESGHLELIEQITAFEAQYPGLLLVGNYRGGVSVGDRIRQGVETSWTS